MILGVTHTHKYTCTHTHIQGSNVGDIGDVTSYIFSTPPDYIKVCYSDAGV